MSELPIIIQNLQELQRMHQLNLELLEQLGIFFEWVLKKNAVLPDREKFESLLHKTQSLMRELYDSASWKILQYQKLSDDSYHGKKPDDKLPEPPFTAKSSDRLLGF